MARNHCPTCSGIGVRHRPESLSGLVRNTQPARRLGAILAAVVVLWVSEALPMAITAFLGVAAAVVLGVAPAQAAFAPFADPLVLQETQLTGRQRPAH